MSNKTDCKCCCMGKVLWLLGLSILGFILWCCMSQESMQEMEGNLVHNLKEKKQEMCDCLFGADGDRI